VTLSSGDAGQVAQVQRGGAALEPGVVFGHFAVAELESASPPRRDQELAVLRIGGRCRAEYEFGQHSIYGQQHGLSPDEITRLNRGPDDPGWPPHDAVILRAVDELYDDNVLSEETWDALSDTYPVPQLIELLSVIGRYWTVSVVAQLTRGTARAWGSGLSGALVIITRSRGYATRPQLLTVVVHMGRPRA
jgi:hypothetical protein